MRWLITTLVWTLIWGREAWTWHACFLVVLGPHDDRYHWSACIHLSSDACQILLLIFKPCLYVARLQKMFKKWVAHSEKCSQSWDAYSIWYTPVLELNWEMTTDMMGLPATSLDGQNCTDTEHLGQAKLINPTGNIHHMTHWSKYFLCSYKNNMQLECNIKYGRFRHQSFMVPHRDPIPKWPKSATNERWYNRPVEQRNLISQACSHRRTPILHGAGRKPTERAHIAVGTAAPFLSPALEIEP